MSLDFRLTAIKGWETLCRDEDRNIRPKTEAIIFATMSTGIGLITEKNYIEFYLRVAAADAMSQWPGRVDPITLEDVKAHIGLQTNVFGQEARTKWLKRHMDGAISEIEYRQKRDAKAAA